MESPEYKKNSMAKKVIKPNIVDMFANNKEITSFSVVLKPFFFFNNFGLLLAIIYMFGLGGLNCDDVDLC